MVKRLLGRILIRPGSFANLYESGRPGWVVIRPLINGQFEGGLEFPYPRSRFKRGALKAALRKALEDTDR